MKKGTMGNKGFTLLELLMVVIIIGILASIALPQWNTFTERAEGSEAVGILQAARAAQEMNKLETGNYIVTGRSVSSYYTLPADPGTKFWKYSDLSGTAATNWKCTATHTKTNTNTIIINVTNGAVNWEGTSTGKPNV
ncbi:MAG: prepilin-type N-terminal cleavage/methylation domain-containing protein [Candidatus Omnitrophica bacterium]|nr:prepilin-type N-terminal cleavage/methylation domain-containing protein [Candidatus Omnitrophota bacterium]